MTPCVTASVTPPTGVATTGLAAAIAAIRALPNDPQFNPYINHCADPDSRGLSQK